MSNFHLFRKHNFLMQIKFKINSKKTAGPFWLPLKISHDNKISRIHYATVFTLIKLLL